MIDVSWRIIPVLKTSGSYDAGGKRRKQKKLKKDQKNNHTSDGAGSPNLQDRIC
jgi:hypothetical protein